MDNGRKLRAGRNCNIANEGQGSFVFGLVKFRHPGYNLTSKNIVSEVFMTNPATTKMSSKGQVVIPEDIRKRLNLKAGAQFIVVGEKDVVIFKSISRPSMKEFDALIATARRQAKDAGLKRSDIEAAIAKTRNKK
ncbi:MAG: AbrB/MazE/SpoVT family DNA-binding domain-containing protein [Syntrophorhabdaceae bacterium]|nr:AbrB/MazE/SpoVT family DNA-binding domain-containing protein [Syntrophorhabdaceae bacterium]MDD5244598.1 AbrB/MazE/SpoVT family DNA-binding domain-containing protein [Syntrophorhabdaceae bacterium]